MKHALMFALMAALLGGCGVVAAVDRMEREADQRACDGFGFRPGTDAYSNCLMQQAAQRAEADERAQDRMELDEALRRSKKR